MISNKVDSKEAGPEMGREVGGAKAHGGAGTKPGAWEGGFREEARRAWVPGTISEMSASSGEERRYM